MSSSSSTSDRFDDVKSTSSLCFESPCCYTENQLKDHHLASCCENLPYYLSDTSNHRIYCEGKTFYCDENYTTKQSYVNSNKCIKQNDRRVEAGETPKRKHGRRLHKSARNRLIGDEQNCNDDAYFLECIPDDNIICRNQETIQERLGCHELKINSPERHQNGYSEKNNLGHYNCCDTSQNANSVWVLRSDLKKPRSMEDRKGRVFKDLNRFNLTNQFNEPLSTSSSSLPLTHVNNMRKSHSNITHRSTCNMFITELGNKSSSAPILKKVNESQDLLSSHIKVCYYFLYL